MPAKKAVKKTTKGKDVRSLICKELGEEAGGAILQKIDKMVKQKAPVSVIEKTVAEDLSKHMQKVNRVADDLIVFIVGPTDQY